MEIPHAYGPRPIRRPFVPGEFAGLFASLAAERSGETEPLRAWTRVAGRELHRAFVAAAFDPASAD